jgi:hypothetical protein
VSAEIERQIRAKLLPGTVKNAEKADDGAPVAKVAKEA